MSVVAGRGRRGRPGRTIVWALLLLGGVLMVMPFVYMLSTSARAGAGRVKAVHGLDVVQRELGHLVTDARVPQARAQPKSRVATRARAPSLSATRRRRSSPKALRADHRRRCAWARGIGGGAWTPTRTRAPPRRASRTSRSTCRADFDAPRAARPRDARPRASRRAPREVVLDTRDLAVDARHRRRRRAAAVRARRPRDPILGRALIDRASRRRERDARRRRVPDEPRGRRAPVARAGADGRWRAPVPVLTGPRHPHADAGSRRRTAPASARPTRRASRSPTACAP